MSTGPSLPRAEAMSRLGTETAFSVLGEVKKLQAAGKDVVSFCIGEPDFDTPEHIVNAGVESLKSGHTHYTAAPGTLEFRQAICTHMKKTRGLEVSPDRVIVTAGAKPIMFYSILSCIERGDEVIYPNPGFPIYESMIKFVGAKAVALPLYESRNFRFDPEELRSLITSRTRMIIINSPHNPTGGILTEKELEVIAELAKKHDLLILADEIYDGILYDGRAHQSLLRMPGMEERTVLLCGHSKNYAMTGWRLGYGVFPQNMVEGVTKLITNSTSCTAAFTQDAGIAALAGTQEPTHKMVEEFNRRRDYIVKELNDMGLRTLSPEGAFYVFSSVDGLNISSKQLQHFFLYHSGVAVLDGECFGRYGRGYIRLSYATSMENIQEGMRRMRAGLEFLSKNGVPKELVVSSPADVERKAGAADDEACMKDVGALTAMLMSLLGNYAQTGHFGGPLAYTPANVVMHLGGQENGGLCYDIRDPKHPFSDKFMLTGGHCIPTCYALWMILYEAMGKMHSETGDQQYYCNPDVAMLAVDALGFRRSPDAVKTLLAENDLEEHPLFSQAKIRGIRALMGHSETTDVTNDVNGGPSGVGAANSTGKSLFWDFVGAAESLKVVAFEGEFAFTEGHAQELKTVALAQQVGKRLRFFYSYNNAGIDDALIGGVVHEKYEKQYDIAMQFKSYGWNVFELDDGADYNKLYEIFRTMEEWPMDDRRPMIVIAKTIKGWWPFAKDGKVGSVDQLISYPSHPYAIKTNSPYFVAMAESFEKNFGVEFVGIREGAPSATRDKLIQFKQNVDVVMSVLEKDNGRLRKWIADRLMHIAKSHERQTAASEATCRIDRVRDPYTDARLHVANLPREEVVVNVVHPTTGKEDAVKINLQLPAGTKWGARRAISEVGKWINYVTGNRMMTIAADLSGSINVENVNLTGHYDPVSNPQGTRLKAAIQECANACTVTGLASQTVSTNPDVHCGLWAMCGTYGAFTPFFYIPLRIFSQQNQESPFKLGVVTIIAGHSGPETAADARSHFGIFAPQVWSLFPRNQIINLNFWDYNDVAPGYFAAVELANRKRDAGIIVVHVARPDFPICDRSKLADSDPCAAAKGMYLLREYEEGKPKHGTVFVQGASSTFNLLSAVPKLEAAGVNVRIVAVVSEELFASQSVEYQNHIIPASSRYDCMYISTMSKRIQPVANLGPLTEEYSMTADWDDKWRTGGLEPEVIAEARLDADSIFAGVKRFADERESRIQRTRDAFAAIASL